MLKRDGTKWGRNGTILFSANNEHPADNIWGIETSYRYHSYCTPTYFCDWSNNAHALYACLKQPDGARREREITKPANRATVRPSASRRLYLPPLQIPSGHDVHNACPQNPHASRTADSKFQILTEKKGELRRASRGCLSKRKRSQVVVRSTDLGYRGT